jgi:hypothetical protein
MNKDEIKSKVLLGGFRKARFELSKAYNSIVEMCWSHPRPPQNLSELIYVIVNDIVDLPKCTNGNYTKFGTYYNDGYLKTCSNRIVCGCYLKIRQEIISNQSVEVRKKRSATYKKTMMERYGVINGFQAESIKKKSRATNLLKYGVEYVAQSPDIQDKVKKTNLERYGVAHSMQSPDIREKSKKTNLERYGAEEVFHSVEIREKIQNTCMERYGVTNPFESTVFQDKARSTIVERYGVNNIGQRHLSDRTKSIIHDSEEFKTFCQGKSFERVSDELRDVTASTIGALARKYDCVNVFTFGKGSIYQSQVEDWLDDLGVKYIRNIRSIISPKEIDIWIPKYDLGIEMDGLFYHSEIAGRKSPTYHYEKQNYAHNNNIRLIQVFTDEWMFKKDIVKEVIRRNMKYSFVENIGARKCQINQLDWTSTAKFLDANHLQGRGSPTRYNYGLTYKDEVVAVMTFANKRKSINSSGWELVRWCQSKNIHGGSHKLLNHVLRELDIGELITYSDRRYFSGNVYKQLGFEFIGVTKQGYCYTDYYHRYNRFNFTKQKLVKDGHPHDKSEWEIMQSLGYDRVWDSGHTKWKLNNISRNI